MTLAKARIRHIQAGDRIRIVKPLVFIRCGYPLDMDAMKKRVEQEQAADIEAFLRKLGFRPEENRIGLRVRKEIIHALAYGYLHRENFGGRLRQIYTQEVPELAGVETTVTRHFYCKTGEYQPLVVSYEGEVDPPTLCDEQGHRILETELHDPQAYTQYAIEDIHVERLE